MGDNRRDDLSRRRLLRAAAAATTGLGTVGGAAAQRVSDRARPAPTDVERIPTTDVTSADVEVVTVPEADEGIRPGSAITTDVGGCTTNFVWKPVDPEDATDEAAAERAREEAGSRYIGTAGHCLLEAAPASENAAVPGEESEDTSDVTVAIDVDGTFGHVVGALETVELGEVVYARQQQPGGDSEIGHDFGLVRIPEDLQDLVDPALPQFGGPDGVLEDGAPQGDPVHMYGNGNGNGEVFATKGRYGVSLGRSLSTQDTAWAYQHRISGGDSGAAIVGSQPGDAPESGGAAAGVATHAVGGVAPPGMGTTIRGCQEMVARDIGLEIEVVQAGDR